MTAFLEEHAVVVLLVLFVGILYWAFRPGKKASFQSHPPPSSDTTESDDHLP